VAELERTRCSADQDAPRCVRSPHHLLLPQSTGAANRTENTSEHRLETHGPEVRTTNIWSTGVRRPRSHREKRYRGVTTDYCQVTSQAFEKLK
jgi:hypothetical protein